MAQVHGIAASNQQGVGLMDHGDPLVSSMLGNAVSSSTPKDFQPSSHMGVLASCPLMNRQACPAPPGMPCVAVGMHRALDSAIGLPRSSTSALRMLAFLMP